MTERERLEALIELGLKLGSELDPRRSLRTFCHAAREIAGARRAMVGIVDDDGARLKYLFTSGMDADETAQLGSPDPRRGVLQLVIAENRCVRSRNPGGDPTALGFSRAHPHVRAHIGAPISTPTEVYGYLSLIDKIDAEEFSVEDERIAELLGAQVGRIYQNSTMYTDAQRHAAELEREIIDRHRTEQRQAVVLAVSQALAESGTLRDGVVRAMSIIGSRLGWDMGAFWLVDRTGSVLRCTEVWQARAHQFREYESLTRSLEFARGIGLPGKVWLEKGPAWSNDVGRELNFARAKTASKAGLRAAFAFPTLIGDEVNGVIEMFGTRYRETDQDALNVFTGVTGPLARFIEKRIAEDVLRERDELSRLAFSGSGAAIFGLDLRGRCLVANAAGLELLGLGSEEEIAGHDVHAILHGSSCPIDQCRIFSEAAAGAGLGDRQRLFRANGSPFTARCSSQPFCRGGVQIGVVLTVSAQSPSMSNMSSMSSPDSSNDLPAGSITRPS